MLSAPPRYPAPTGLSGIQADADATGQFGVLYPLLDRERRAQCSPGGFEDDQRLVAAKLDQPALVLADGGADELGKCRRKLGGGLVAVLLGEAGVAAHVADQERPERRRPCRRRGHLASPCGRMRLGDQIGARSIALVRALCERLRDHAIERFRQLRTER